MLKHDIFAPSRDFQNRIEQPSTVQAETKKGACNARSFVGANWIGSTNTAAQIFGPLTAAGRTSTGGATRRFTASVLLGNQLDSVAGPILAFQFQVFWEHELATENLDIEIRLKRFSAGGPAGAFV